MFTRIALLFLATVFTGCSSVPVLPETSQLGPPQQQSQIQLVEPVSWLEVDKGQVKLYAGLIPGAYVAEKENMLGTFYRGAAGSYFLLTAATSDFWGTAPAYLIRMEGGIWKSKKDGELRIYRYIDPDAFYRRKSVDGQGHPSQIMSYIGVQDAQLRQSGSASSQLNQIAVEKTLQSTGPVAPTAVGAAIGTAIVGAMIYADQGKIDLIAPSAQWNEQLRNHVKVLK